MSSDDAQMILVGACGWKHPQWNSRYYPEDLPSDWQLSFYSNDLNTVMVPCRDWVDALPETLESWIDDASEGFRFFVELLASVCLTMANDETYMASICSRLERFGNRLAGIYLSNDRQDVDLCFHCRSVLERLAGRHVLYTQEPLPCISALRVWRCDDNNMDMPEHGCMLLLDDGLAGGDSSDLRKVRKCIEAFLEPTLVGHNAENGELAIIVDQVDSNDIDAGQVLQLRRLVEMMV